MATACYSAAAAATAAASVARITATQARLRLCVNFANVFLMLTSYFRRKKKGLLTFVDLHYGRTTGRCEVEVIKMLDFFLLQNCHTSVDALTTMLPDAF